MSGKSIRELFAAGSVVASMIFVGLQIRQANTLAEAAAYQELGLATSGNWITAAFNPQLNSLMWENNRVWNDSTWWANLSQSEIDQMASLQVGTLRAYEAVYTQVQLGLLKPEALKSMGWSVTIEQGPSILWPQIRTVMDPYFVAYLEDAWGIAP